MNVGSLIDRLGGNKAVQEMTGLSKGRISQWRTENHVPRSWLKFLQAHRPQAFTDDASAGTADDAEPEPAGASA